MVSIFNQLKLIYINNYQVSGWDDRNIEVILNEIEFK